MNPENGAVPAAPPFRDPHLPGQVPGPGRDRRPVAEVPDRGFYFLGDPVLEPREFFRVQPAGEHGPATGCSGARASRSAFSEAAIPVGSSALFGR